RSGRVFIAGDAAHQMSPTGGLGMNTGVGDAVDLGWKLAAVLDGWGGQVLLDAYQIERKPVAVTSVTASSRVYQETMALPGGPLLLEDSSDGAAHRERFRRAFDGKRAVTEPISEQAKLGYCYDASPIVVPDGSLPISYEAPSFIPSARPGTRAPHAWVRPGISTLDYFGDGFVLLCLGVEPYDARDLQRCADERGVPFRVVEVRDPGIAKLYETALVLVRPDGHVAWRSNTPPADPGRLLDRVRGAMTNTKGDAACESPQSKATISPS